MLKVSMIGASTLTCKISTKLEVPTIREFYKYNTKGHKAKVGPKGTPPCVTHSNEIDQIVTISTIETFERSLP